MEAMRKQTMHIYDSNAETQSMLEEVKAQREQFDQSKESLMQSHDWILNNMNTVEKSWSDLLLRILLNSRLIR